MQFHRAVEIILDTLAHDQANMLLLWKDFHNEPVSVSIRKVYSPREFFGEYWALTPTQKNVNDVPAALFDNTMLGSLTSSSKYLEDVASLLTRYNKHFRLVLLHIFDKANPTSFRVEDPWIHRNQNAVRAIQQVRAKSLADLRSYAETNWDDDGRPVLLQDILASLWYRR